MVDETLPFVSIIMPVRNEEDFIERAIWSVLNNDYPSNKIEVLVVDGCSDDGTQDLVEEIAAEDSKVKLLKNPRRIVSSGMNIGLKACRGEVFIRIDGHTEIPSDFVRESVTCLTEHPEAWIAGGAIENVADSYMGAAIAAAMKSGLGVGNSYFRLGNYEGWVDTLAFGAHHKWILERIGYFDEELVRNQDDEFNYRVIRAGGKIWMSKSVKSRYWARASFKKLWRQYFQYGFWRIRTLQKHRRPATLRQIVPLLFALSIIVLLLAGFAWVALWWLLITELGVYVAALICGSIQVGSRSGWRYSFIAPVVFGILHFAYGVGCLWGIVRFVLLRGFGMKPPDRLALSR